MFRSSRHQTQGFTLIEILVSLLITGILASITAPSLLNWYNNKKIEDVLTQVEGALKIAQSSSIKLSTTCTVTITPRTSTAAPTISAVPSQCLPTGTRSITGVNANIATDGFGSTSISFSSKGTASIVANKSVIVVYDQDSSTGRKMKCLVVSNGIGMMRTGNYQQSTPPTSASNVDDVERSCVASS
jgi:prepilin-type N-terminal cleavage/methylation domain-containing protein